MVTILITGCGGHYMVDCLSCYKGKKVKGETLRVIGVATQRDAEIEKMLDKFIVVPRSDAEGYIDVLLRLCKENAVDILIPTIDCELVPLYESRDEFMAIGTKLSMTLNNNIKLVTNKLEFMRFMKDNDYPTAEFHMFNDRDSLEKALESLGYPDNPVVVKIVDGAGSRGVRILDEAHDSYFSFLHEKPGSKRMTKKEFLNMMEGQGERWIDMIAMEYLSGDEYSVDMLVHEGNVLYMVGRRNTVIDNSIPIESVSEANNSAYCTCMRIAHDLDLDGNIGVDFIFNDKGQAIPTEVNARITATMSLPAESGINLALFQVMKLEGETLPVTIPEYGVRLKRNRVAQFERR